NRPLTDFGGKTSIFSHPVYLFLRELSLQDFRGGSVRHYSVDLSESVSASSWAQKLVSGHWAFYR
ncbi:hypothetical protein, partial [Escherichia coli]|uniref:hypothetical protein n=1 Tax=Escherichia coli TaxID=562 RepID=UPI001BB4815C